jgi:hypothetical protein
MQLPASQAPLAQSAPLRQEPPSAQRAHSGLAPPQSTPDSSPLDKPSLQLAGLHKPLLHTRLSQSLGVTQGDPGGQPGHSPPPQSVRTSLPLCAPSWHELSMQVRVAGAQNAPAPQSVSVLQEAVTEHGSGQPAPQSTAGSPPFWTPSAQDDAAHTAFSQRPDVQSAATLQLLPAAQRVGQAWPQSMAGSRPFCTPSLQLEPFARHSGPEHSGTSHVLRSSPAGHAAVQLPSWQRCEGSHCSSLLQQAGPTQPAPGSSPAPASWPRSAELPS